MEVAEQEKVARPLWGVLKTGNKLTSHLWRPQIMGNGLVQSYCGVDKSLRYVYFDEIPTHVCQLCRKRQERENGECSDED